MRRALLALALLAACAEAEAPPEPAPAVSFRTPGTMIASTTRGGPQDLAGEWVVSRATPGALVGPGDRVTLVAGTDLGLTWRLGGVEIPTAMTEPGRYVGGGGARFWVLWVDDDFRTAVVGTPDGSFGWIMDRPGEASPDRTVAAERMLAFNGYREGVL